MKRDDFVDTLMRRLGNNQDATLREDIIAEMVIAQGQLLEQDVFKPWFLISEESSSATIVADERVLLPVDFLSFWEESPVYRYDTELADPYIAMPREDWGDITSNLDYSGTPTHFDMAGRYLMMRPVPDAIYPLRFWYYKRGSDLTGAYGDSNNIENVWLEHANDWLMGEVGFVIASQYLQMKDNAAALFTSQATRARNRVMSLNIAQQEILKERIIGG